MMIAQTMTLFAMAIASFAANSPAGQEKQDANSSSTPLPFFDRLDKNKDGYLSENEIPDWLAKHLRDIDTDGDGKISRAEMVKARELVAVRRAALNNEKPKSDSAKKPGELSNLFERLDKNHDGKLSAEEIPSSIRTRLAKADLNGDGEISREEFNRAVIRINEIAAREKAEMASPLRKTEKPAEKTRPDRKDQQAAKPPAEEMEAMPKEKSKDNPPKGDDNAKRKKKGPDSAKRKPGDIDPKIAFNRLDRNKDGKLSRDELPEAARQAFDRLDKNGDGFLDHQEFEAAVAYLRRANGRGGPPGSPSRSPRNLFNEQDGDADGRITREEAHGILAEKFDELDTNKDGKLDLFEVENGLKTEAPKEPPAAPPAKKKK